MMAHTTNGKDAAPWNEISADDKADKNRTFHQNMKAYCSDVMPMEVFLVIREEAYWLYLTPTEATVVNCYVCLVDDNHTFLPRYSLPYLPMMSL
mmetsp:Transcript_51085/g.61537  ORF Transcript_51085/g.61537 Transcript_51085/m.61537 type:complete len:94 (+) Transcript_51085:1245-1526(+)